MATGKYQEWLTEDNLKRVEQWFRDGLNDIQVSKNMGISKTTFYDWSKKYPAISEAIKKGKAPIDYEIENAMFRSAMGYEVEEVQTTIIKNNDGTSSTKVTKTKKHVPANTTAQIFIMKNRRPEVWRDRQTTEITGKMEFENPMTKLSVAELRKLANKK